MDQPAPVAVVESPKPNRLLFPLIGLLILTIGIGVGLVVGKYLFSPIPTPTPIVYTSPTPMPIEFTFPTPLPNATANWTTYTNTKYLYSVKIPPGWEPERGSAAGPLTDTELQKNDSVFWRKNNSMISIRVLEDCTDLGKCFKEFQAAADNRAGFSGVQYTTIAFKTTRGIYQNIPSIEARSTYGESVNAVRGIFFVYKDKLWLLETQRLLSISDDVDQILSTFKFTQ